MAGRRFLDSHVQKCETLVRLINWRGFKPALDALFMSVYIKAGFLFDALFLSVFQEKKAAKFAIIPLTQYFMHISGAFLFVL